MTAEGRWANVAFAAMVCYVYIPTNRSKTLYVDVGSGSFASLRMTAESWWASMAFAAMVYYVYILTNRSKTLYVGVTNNLVRRVHEHKEKKIPGFTRAYNLDRLVYYELFGDIRSAIQREKQIKGWLRRKKLAVIESRNPQWQDLTPLLSP